MPLLIQTQRWRDRKPNGPQEIDWTHPLARDLAAAFIFNEGAGDLRNLVSGAFAVNNGLDHIVDVKGRGVKANSKLDDARLTLPADALENSGDISAFFVGAPASAGTSSTRRIFHYGPLFLGTTGGLLWGNSTSSKMLIGWGSSAGFKTASSTAAFFSAGVTNAFGFTFKSGVNCRMFKDGLFMEGPVATDARNGATDTQLVLFERPNNATSRDWNGDAFVLYLWNRVLSDDEQAWINAEPYVLLRPRRRRRLFTVVSGGAKSGSVVLSGAGILAVVARKGAVASIGVTARPVLALVAFKGAIAASVLGAIGVVSVLGQAVRQGAVSLTAVATISSIEASARLAAALLSAGGFLVVSGSTLSSPAIEGRIALAGIQISVWSVSGQAGIRVALAGRSVRSVAFTGHLP